MLCCGGGVLVLAVLLGLICAVGAAGCEGGPGSRGQYRAAASCGSSRFLRHQGHSRYCRRLMTARRPLCERREARPPRPPAIAPLGAGRVAVVLGASDWTRDDGEPVRLDEALPAIARKVISTMEKADPLDQSADDIEAIGVDAAGIRAAFRGRHSLQARPGGRRAADSRCCWQATPKDTGRRSGICSIACSSGTWATTTGTTRPLRPSYHQLYPPEKGQPRTFVEAQYPAKLAPLDLARAAQSDPARDSHSKFIKGDQRSRRRRF